MSPFATHHPVLWWEGTGKSSQGLENNGANSGVDTQKHSTLRAYTASSFINRIEEWECVKKTWLHLFRRISKISLLAT